MNLYLRRITAKICLYSLLSLTPGCRTDNTFRFQNPPGGFQPFEMQIETPAVQFDYAVEAVSSEAPLTLTDPRDPEPWPLGLPEVIQITLENSEVMRDLGARILSTPQLNATVYDPAVIQSDPRSGVEAALSAFDAQFATSTFWNRNERSLNNIFFGGGTPSLFQNTATFSAELAKTSATGTSFALRNLTDYDRNNSPVNRFRSIYDTVIQGEVRHPLLQGSGLEFNRIAGPQAVPGVYNGVVLARINTDVALAEFERQVRDHMRQVEQAYWQLYFAYRNLDALLSARDRTLEVWQRLKDQQEVGTQSAAEEAPAREQYFQAHAAVQNALSGTPDGQVGVYQSERDLRLLMGLPVSDGRLIRPADAPTRTRAVFDWEDSVEQALQRRVEMRSVGWLLRGRELEVVAARNFLQMRLDLVGQYNWRGFGDDLFGQRGVENGSAWRDLFNGDLQEWQLGVQLSTPIGNRIGHAAVRNAELVLARERARMREVQRQIVSDLGASFAELERSREVSKTNYNRGWAARERLDKAQARYDVRTELLEFVLEAQQRVFEADSAFSRSLVDYTLAISGIHYARGSYLSYLGIELAEGPWSDRAYAAAAKEAHRIGPRRLKNYCFMAPTPISSGVYPQLIDPTSPMPEPAPGSAQVPALEPLPVHPADSSQPSESPPSEFQSSESQPSEFQSSESQSAPSPLPGPGA